MIKKIFKVVCGIIVSLILISLLLLFTIDQWLLYKDDQILAENKFDQKLWMEAGLEDVSNGYQNFNHHQRICTRGRMYHDITKTHLKKGMSKDDVLNLLGKPNFGLKFLKNNKRKYCLEYELGGCTVWFSGPGKLLSICLDNNKVVEIFHLSGNNDAEDFKIE